MGAGTDSRVAPATEEALSPDAPRHGLLGRSSAPATGGAGRTLPERRRLLRGAGLLGAMGVLGTGGVAAVSRPGTDSRTVISLWSQTVAFDGAGERVLVGARGSAAAPEAGAMPGTPVARGASGMPVSALQSGTRLVRGLGASHPIVLASDAFMKAARPWLSAVPEDLRDLARSALQDLWVLSEGMPAPVAAWSPSWRYVWPRDAAFCAVALARVGHAERAAQILLHLQSLQAHDGWFEARYEPSTGARPDSRPRQLDGTGLLLWAVEEVLETVGPRDRVDLAGSLSDLVDRSTSLLMELTEAGTALPPATPDYWEVREKHVTLWTMAATLRGLRAAATLTAESPVSRAAESFEALLHGSFGAAGYSGTAPAGARTRRWHCSTPPACRASCPPGSCGPCAHGSRVPEEASPPVSPGGRTGSAGHRPPACWVSHWHEPAITPMLTRCSAGWRAIAPRWGRCPRRCCSTADPRRWLRWRGRQRTCCSRSTRSDRGRSTSQVTGIDLPAAPPGRAVQRSDSRICVTACAGAIFVVSIVRASSGAASRGTSSRS